MVSRSARVLVFHDPGRAEARILSELLAALRCCYDRVATDTSVLSLEEYRAYL